MTDPASAQPVMTAQDLAGLPQPPADHTIAYGPASQQVAELRLPKGRGPHPVVVVIHGGCWEVPWGFDQVRSLASALTAHGYATWSLEYRRIGDTGGGWPGTLEDVARGADHLREAGSAYPLDLDHVVALGHSAGGHLALWLAARHRLPRDSPLHAAQPLPLRGVVSLAGITDLRAGAAKRVCGEAIPRLVGGPPGEWADRLRQSSPIELVPLGVPQRLLWGARDDIIPIEQARAYAAAATAAGDAVEVRILDGVGHFELVDPARSAYAAVRDAIRAVASR